MVFEEADEVARRNGATGSNKLYAVPGVAREQDDAWSTSIRSFAVTVIQPLYGRRSKATLAHTMCSSLQGHVGRQSHGVCNRFRPGVRMRGRQAVALQRRILSGFVDYSQPSAARNSHRRPAKQPAHHPPLTSHRQCSGCETPEMLGITLALQ